MKEKKKKDKKKKEVVAEEVKVSKDIAADEDVKKKKKHVADEAGETQKEDLFRFMSKFVVMKTKRKLIPKSTHTHGDADGVRGNVGNRDLCDDVYGVGPSVSPKRHCVHVPTSVVDGGAADGGVLYDNVCGVGPSVFPETQHICCSVSDAVLGTRIKTPEVPAVALDIFSNTPSQQPALVSQECIPPSAIGRQPPCDPMSDVGVSGGSAALHTHFQDTMNVIHPHIPSNSRAALGSQQLSTPVRSPRVREVPNVNNRARARLQLFRTAREKFEDTNIPNFKVRLYNVIGAREYELPTGDMLGAIVYEEGPEANMDYDIVLEERSGHPQRVHKLHPSYRSLQFPLFFLYGEDGYQKEMKMVGSNGSSSQQKRLTMLAYYSYYLHDHANRYNYLSRTRRLFQQYVVTAFCVVEQNRIEFIREHQNDIRNEYLSPRYLSCHGNPSCFITFTCNVNPRVFEMKIHQFVAYLRDSQPFGKVVAVLYTVEFQKRCLPHCRTLLWIDESVRIRRYEDIDIYISAELPLPNVDPEGYRIVSELMMHGPCGLSGFVHYKRRAVDATMMRQGVELDNGRVTISNWYITMVLSSTYSTPPTSTPPTIQESLAKLADKIDKLELIVKRFIAKRLAESTTNLVSITSQTTITETTTDHVITAQNTSCHVTKINKPDNTIVKSLTDSTVENEVFTQIPFSPVFGLHDIPTQKTPKLMHDIAIFHQTTLNETYRRAPLIESMLVILCCVNTFFIGPQCCPPKLVFLRIEPKPPWERGDPRYKTMILEDRDRFQVRSIDTNKSKDDIVMHDSYMHYVAFPGFKSG
ncbi:DNA helicase [Tanacetum coccineum]|uniref:DNA helicase n=1 Tax=Tanacetum coccineum TaxID=301880 RepID=A0ABQ5BNR4_9ASTR